MREINFDQLEFTPIPKPQDLSGVTIIFDRSPGTPAETQPRPQGRPSSYTPDLAREICKRIASGESLRNICRDEHMPNAATVHDWVLEDREGFHKQYARAREIQAENMFDEILNISDDGENDYMTITKGDFSYNVEDREVTSRSKLRVDSRKWYLSKVLPKKFGEKLDVTSDGKQIKGNTIVFKNFKNEAGS